MRSGGKLGALAAILILIPAAVSSAGQTSKASADTGARLVAEALRAAGVVDPVERIEKQRDVRDALDRLVMKMGEGRPTYRRAARLHRLLHRDYFRQYRQYADGLDDVVASGEFNCLSATLFYGLAARELGFDVLVLEQPGHLLLGLSVAGRRVDVETTTPGGFDRPRDVTELTGDWASMFRGIPGLENTGTADGSEGHVANPYLELSLESTLGFAWLNTAWRTLETGRSLDAARGVVESTRFLADLSSQEGSVRRLLSRAFRTEYESGRFDDAYRIAAIEAELFPATTTSLDRLLAAAVKRVEDLCDVDAPIEAATVVEDIRRIVAPGRVLTRFERRAWPIVTAAAVRLADWRLATRAAENYANVEPDAVEARRVLDWVARRRFEASAAGLPPACSEAETPEQSVVLH
jgi:hypothetical protein